MKAHAAKRSGLELQFKTFKGRSGKSYLVFRTLKGGYHVFAEMEAKTAAQDCGAASGNTREQWKKLWSRDASPDREPAHSPAPKGKSFLTRLKTEKKTS
ncbi:MAG TPA: hypothetical protein VG889_10685 [Rhizomicrobium sp.]|nr:hypothetical protein [Rhizomicrobium sp.]